jgi:hypothetical protein
MPSISVTNPELITSIDLGTATPKLGGVVDLNNFKILTTIDADEQDLTGFQNYSHLTSLTTVNLFKNKLAGDVLDFSSSPNCTEINLYENNFNGNLPSTLPSGIQKFFAYNNNISINAQIPNLKPYTNLAIFQVGFQSDTFGVSANSSSPKRSGASTLANTATTDADGITGSIPLSIRRFFINMTNLSPLSKLELLTQFYDTFKDQATNYVRTTAVNGVLYGPGNPGRTPTINVGGSEETKFSGSGAPYSDTTSLLGKHSGVTVGAAKTNLTGVGFNLYGF